MLSSRRADPNAPVVPEDFEFTGDETVAITLIVDEKPVVVQMTLTELKAALDGLA